MSSWGVVYRISPTLIVSNRGTVDDMYGRIQLLGNNCLEG